MLSQQLRTPLTPVLASALALESQPELPEEIHDSLQMIRRNVELEARLIDDLLDLTRIDRGTKCSLISKSLTLTHCWRAL